MEIEYCKKPSLVAPKFTEISLFEYWFASFKSTKCPFPVKTEYINLYGLVGTLISVLKTLPTGTLFLKDIWWISNKFSNLHRVGNKKNKEV